MEPHAPDSTQLGIHDTEQSDKSPQLKRVLPLRIVKRSDSTCGEDADGRPCRRCSQATTESRGSAVDSTGGEERLTVPKVRGSRTSQVFDSLCDVDESPVPLGREAYLRNGNSLNPCPKDIADTVGRLCGAWSSDHAHRAKTAIKPILQC